MSDRQAVQREPITCIMSQIADDTIFSAWAKTLWRNAMKPLCFFAWAKMGAQQVAPERQ